jgi:hypothetical protein
MLNAAWRVGKSLLRALLGMEDKTLDINLEKYKENAEVHKEALAASVEIEKLNAMQRISDNAHTVTRWIRPSFAFLVWIYIAAIVLVGMPGFEEYEVRRIPEQIELWFGIIMGFYFAGRPVEKLIDKWGKKDK